MRHFSSDRRAGSVLLALTAVFGFLTIDYVFQPSEALRDVLNVAVYNNLMIASGLVCVALGVVGWRPGRAWGLIAAGLLVFSISDCLYLYETAVGSYTYGSPTDLGWVAGGLLLAWAAWQPRAETIDVIVEGRWLLVAPVTSGLLALGVLVYDHGRPVNPLALALAA